MANPAKPSLLKNPVQLAVVGAAHGIRGEVRVKSFTEDPLALGHYGPLRTEDGRILTVKSLRPSREVVIVRFAEIADRNAAEAINGQALFVERAMLGDELEEEEFFHADLVGLEVRDQAEQILGHVIAVHNFGAGDLLEFKPPQATSVLIPFTLDAVPTINVSAGYIMIDIAAAGLLTDDPADAPEPGRAEPGTSMPGRRGDTGSKI